MTVDDAPVVDLAALLRPLVAVVTSCNSGPFGTNYVGDDRPTLPGGLAHFAQWVNRDIDAMDR